MGEKGMMGDVAAGAQAAATEASSLVATTIERAQSTVIHEASGVVGAIKAEAVGAVAKGVVDEGRSRIRRDGSAAAGDGGAGGDSGARGATSDGAGDEGTNALDGP